MEYTLKANQVGQMVMPAHVRKAWGDTYKMLPNSKGGAIYPIDAEPEEIIDSLKVVIQDLQNQIKRKKWHR